MADKPFKIFPQPVAKDGSLIIIQTGSLETHDVKLYNINDVVDVLNEQHETIQQLKRENIEEIFDRAVERTYDKYMDSLKAEEVLDYLTDCFYDLLKE